MKMKMAAALAALITATAPAAALEFNWSYYSDAAHAVTSYGTLTVNGNGNTTQIYNRDAYVVTGISGKRNGVAITGLVQAFPVAHGGSDRYLFTSEIPFSYSGLSFSLADGRFVNFFDVFFFTTFFDPDYVYGGVPLAAERVSTSMSGDDDLEFTTGRFNYGASAAVPEPATWAMFIGGFAVVGVSVRRRRNRRALVAA